MSLADKLIRKQQESVEEETHTDEYGLVFPDESDLPRFWEYLVARALKSSPHIHVRRGHKWLYKEHEILFPHEATIMELTHYYKRIPRRAVHYIYNRLYEVAPRLDPKKIALTPTLLWDIDKQELIEMREPINTITDWSVK